MSSVQPCVGVLFVFFFFFNGAPTPDIYTAQYTLSLHDALPIVQVTAEDAAGRIGTGFTGNVTVAIGANPGSGTLSGTTTVAAVSGVATFSTLSVNKAGTGYTLTAGATGLTTATSS